MKISGILILSGLLLAAASPEGSKLTGTWIMYKVIQSDKDVTTEHNPNQDRYLILKGDGSFETGGTPFGMNTGSYAYDPGEHTLFLDSDAGPEDDSHWKVTLKKDTMHWQGIGSQWAEEFELIHTRKKD